MRRNKHKIVYHCIALVKQPISHRVGIPVTLSPLLLKNVTSNSKEKEGDDCTLDKIESLKSFTQEELSDLGLRFELTK